MDVKRDNDDTTITSRRTRGHDGSGSDALTALLISMNKGSSNDGGHDGSGGDALTPMLNAMDKDGSNDGGHNGGGANALITLSKV
jgi:hypothetical protein